MNISRHLAWGDIKEHKRIYAIIIIVIALTMTSFMLENAYLNYMMQVVDDTTKIITSDAIVTDKSCNIRDLYGTEVELKDAKKIADKIERELPGYETTIRVTAQATYGLGTAGEATDGCTIQGIDPSNDDKISGIKGKIVEGRFFNERDNVLRGHTPLYITVEGPGALPDFTYGSGQKLFQEEEPYPIIVGATVAKIHPSVGIGKTLSVTMSMSGRETSYAVVTVKVIGMYESGTPTLDALMWFMHADSLREIKSYGKITGRDWNIPGVGTFRGFNPIEIDRSRGDVILVKAADSVQGFNPMGNSDEIKNNVKDVVPNLNVFGWHDFLVYIAGSMQDVITIMLWGSIIVTLFLCGAAIKYVMDSIVMRKTREIGTFKAFGARDRVIFKIFLYQGLIIGLIAGLLGIILSVIVMYFVNWYGFNVQFIAGTQLKIGFIANWFTLLVTMLLPVTLAVLAAAIPAKKASMLSPVEALRKGELSL